MNAATIPAKVLSKKMIRIIYKVKVLMIGELAAAKMIASL